MSLFIYLERDFFELKLKNKNILSLNTSFKSFFMLLIDLFGLFLYKKSTGLRFYNIVSPITINPKSFD